MLYITLSTCGTIDGSLFVGFPSNKFLNSAFRLTCASPPVDKGQCDCLYVVAVGCVQVSLSAIGFVSLAAHVMTSVLSIDVSESMVRDTV